MKSLLKNILPIKYRQHPIFVRFRMWLNYRFKLSGRLVQQLSFQKGNGTYPDIKGKRILLPIIETSHYQHLHLSIIAKALELRGAKIKVLICGQFLDGCEIKSVRNENDSDPCWECRFHENNVLPLFNLDVLRLSDIITEIERSKFRTEANQLLKLKDKPIIRHGIQLNRAIEDSIIRYFYGAVPKDELVMGRVKSDHAMTALISAEVCNIIDNTWKPDVVLTNMYCYSAWDPIFEYYNKNGNRLKSVSLNQFDYYSILYNKFEIYRSSKRFNDYLVSRKNKQLNIMEKRKLKKFIQMRISGQSKVFTHFSFFDNSGSLDLFKNHFTINKRKRNIFLFSNVYWDIGLSDCAWLYNDVLEWVLATIKIIKNYSECHLYVKPHPLEVFDSSSSLKGVSQVIKEHYPKLPENITIIEPEWKIKTYDLFPFIDLGVIFNGTLGLEMMLSDIPVVSTGKTTHQGLGFSMEPETVEQYREILIDDNVPYSVDRDKLELFAYFYFIKTRIPWRLTKQAYADNFDGFTINSLDDLLPGKDKYLDHLCNCILESENMVPEGWPDE